MATMMDTVGLTSIPTTTSSDVAGPNIGAGRVKRKERGSFGYNRRKQAKRRSRKPRQRIVSFCWEGPDPDLPIELARIVGEYAVCDTCRTLESGRFYLPLDEWMVYCSDITKNLDEWASYVIATASRANCCFPDDYGVTPFLMPMCQQCDLLFTLGRVTALNAPIHYDEEKAEYYVDLKDHFASWRHQWRLRQVSFGYKRWKDRFNTYTHPVSFASIPYVLCTCTPYSDVKRPNPFA